MENYRHLFLQQDEIAHLNHGSFGACPKEIFEDYQNWQNELEKGPMQFMIKKAPEQLKISRDALGDFIGCDGDDLVFTTNPSYAINIITKSLQLNPGDEILATNIEYGAMDRTWNYYCKKAGAKYVRQHITLPITSKERIVEEFFKGHTSKTKAIFISHITSSTALRLPVEEICAKAKELGLLTIVDGAHVPGHIDLDLSTLQADIYTGACHKWLLTPKGNSFLYVKKEYQHLFDPLIISWGYEADFPSSSLFIDWHEYQGTRDYAAFLTTPKAIEWRQNHDWKSVSEKCKQVILNNYENLCSIAGSKPICPISNDFLVQMCSIPIQCDNNLELQAKLFSDYRVEVPVFKQDSDIYLRMSFNGYNSTDEIERLKIAMQDLINKGEIHV